MACRISDVVGSIQEGKRHFHSFRAAGRKYPSLAPVRRFFVKATRNTASAVFLDSAIECWIHQVNVLSNRSVGDRLELGLRGLLQLSRTKGKCHGGSASRYAHSISGMLHTNVIAELH